MSTENTTTTTSSIITTYKTSRALPTSLLQNLLKPFGNKLIQPGDALPVGSPVLTPDSSVYKHCDVQHSIVESINIYTITAKQARTSSRDRNDPSNQQKDVAEQARKRKQIYYFCGGGWQSPPSKEHWKLCAQLAQAGMDSGVETTVSVVSYPLAPHSPASVTLPVLKRLYYTLLSPPPPSHTTNNDTTVTAAAATDSDTEIILAGDSSGANIALSLTLSILNADARAPAPHALVLLSPPCDLRNTNAAMQDIETHDPVLSVAFVKSTARAWCTGVRDDTPAAHPQPAIAYDDPRVSPLLADVAVLRTRGVQVHGVVGEYDVLTPDALLFRDKLQREGVRGKWLEWEKQMHCFILAGAGYGLPEGKEAVEWLEGVLFG